MADELIINLCPPGMVPTRADTPHVPLTIVNKWAMAMGGHVRVGLGAIWYDDARTRLATKPDLVARLVAIARAMGREPASPSLVRDRLRIRQPASDSVS